MDKKQTLIKAIVSVVIVAAAVFLLARGKVFYHLQNRGELGPLSREDIEYLSVEAPKATSMDGTINAADWQATYPYIVASMGANKENDYVISYLEQDPYLVNIYEGYGFAKDYGSARGHEYTLEDVNKTLRPHAKASCLTCKTPNFAKLVNDEGVGVYSMPFEEVMALMEENISCYTCHGNDAGNAGAITITHSYVNKALGDNAYSIDPATLSCGQCHIEYYFTPEDSETMMPYHSVEEMTPDAILAYYNEMGFYDWVQESTGAKMLKAQHPEMETFLQGKHAALLNCADCHMEIQMAEDGTVYHSHYLDSPLKSEAILETCAACHGDTDMVAFVQKLQERVTARETEVGNNLSAFKDALAEANGSGSMSEEALEEVRDVYRSAQWYFDFCYVENAEGAHNSELAYYCLDKSQELIDSGMALLGK
ncbi:MAG: ammonia-forming cytochrome c nitrite reductase subunit c552 [Firmicutes bacterium]|nr:ammonia-forming cytochrome c nitrite reductase subunit c552 [Bacillota bacterium]